MYSCFFYGDIKQINTVLRGYHDPQVSYFVADKKDINGVKHRKAGYTYCTFTKYSIDHHIHLQSLHVNIKAGVKMWNVKDWLRWVLSSWSRDSSTWSSACRSGGKVLKVVCISDVCWPWRPFSPRSPAITMTEWENIDKEVWQWNDSHVALHPVFWCLCGWILLTFLLCVNTSHLPTLSLKSTGQTIRTRGIKCALWNRSLS